MNNFVENLNEILSISESSKKHQKRNNINIG